jgi:hypothetical protein
MLHEAGCAATVHYDGLAALMMRQRPDFSSLRALAGSTLRLRESHRVFSSLLEKLEGADLIIVVANVPGSFSPGFLPNVELLRERFPSTPVVNYDLHYLPTLDSWGRFLLKGERTQLTQADVSVFDKGRFGLERYDWYLMASVGTEVPLPSGAHPYSLIGLDLDDGTLFPDQKGEVRALLDFAQDRGNYPSFRDVQIAALEKSGIEYEVLDGSYTIEQIRAIYRRTSLYFLASSEAFGLPVCELQACGSLVFTPDPYWPASHWVGRNYYAKREPRLSPNFVVYENDVERLSDLVRTTASVVNPVKVRETFEEYQPELLHGDRAELERFLADVSSGKIHSRLHREHASVGR